MTKIYFNEKQKEFIESPLESMRIIGIPGGGKTRTIIEYITNKNATGIIKRANEFLLLTFSRKACNDFLEKGSRIHKTLFTNSSIKTIHAISKIIVTKVCNKSCSSLKTIVITALRAIEALNNPREYFLEHDILANLKVLIVDEAQDISESQYALIAKIGEVLSIPIIMVGDPNQNIYQFQQGSDKYLRNHPGKEIVFVHNYRSSNEIVDFINEFRPWNDYPKMVSAADLSGNKPKIHSLQSDEICKKIHSIIKHSAYLPHEIAIIGPVRKSKEFGTDDYRSIGLSLIENYFARKNVKFLKYYSDDNRDEFTMAKNVTTQKNHINLLTIHGSKGLEFKQVILINFHYFTYGIWPSTQSFNEFKYLWYVAVSRAMESLHIIVDAKKAVFPFTCPKEYYEVSGVIKTNDGVKHRDEKVERLYSVTDIINQMSDIQMYNFEKQLNFVGVKNPSDENHCGGDDKEVFLARINECDDSGSDFDCAFSDDEDSKENNNAQSLISSGHAERNETYVTISRLWDEETLPPIKNKEEYSALYGIYIENLFTLLVQIKNGNKEEFILAKKQLVKNTIVVPRNYSSSFSQFSLKVGKQILEQGITLEQLMSIKNRFGKEISIMSFIISECNSIGIGVNEQLRVFLESELKFYSEKYANEILDKILVKNEGYERDLFDYVIYEYQLNEEKKYWLQCDFTSEFASLSPYITRIKSYIASLDETDTSGYKFQKTFYSTNMEIFGIPDIINKKTIIELKFINEIDINHYIQVILYGLIRYAPVVSRDLWQLTLINLQQGIKYNIVISEAIKLFEMQRYLCTIMDIKLNYTVFIYDLETTGLDTETCEIVECHIREYFYNEIIVDDLVIPVRELPDEIVKLTGITDKELRIKGITIQSLRKKIATIFKTCNNPIFIAHNGTQFDHKIMQRLKIFPENYKFLLDSKTIIGQFYTQKNLYKSKETSLIKMHKEIVNKEIKNAHRANADVSMIVEIFQKLGVTLNTILAL